MASNLSVTSTDGRVDVVRVPEGIQADSSSNQGYQSGRGHPDEIEDIVSIGIALSTAEQLRNARDEVDLIQLLGVEEDTARDFILRSDVETARDRLAKREEKERLKDLGVDEEQARELVSEDLVELPGEKLAKEDYFFDAVREVVIDLLSINLSKEDEVAVFRTFESRLADKIREKESDTTNRERTQNEEEDRRNVKN